MKSKYLVQITAQNPMLATGGFFTIDGAMTRAVAEEKAAAVRSAETYARGAQARAVRVIAAAKWRVEHSVANRAAMKG